MSQLPTLVSPRARELDSLTETSLWPSGGQTFFGKPTAGGVHTAIRSQPLFDTTLRFVLLQSRASANGQRGNQTRGCDPGDSRRLAFHKEKEKKQTRQPSPVQYSAVLSWVHCAGILCYVVLCFDHCLVHLIQQKKSVGPTTLQSTRVDKQTEVHKWRARLHPPKKMARDRSVQKGTKLLPGPFPHATTTHGSFCGTVRYSDLCAHKGHRSCIIQGVRVCRQP